MAPTFHLIKGRFFFDDLKILHEKLGQALKVTQVNDYYPYGMRTSASWQNEAFEGTGFLYQSLFAEYDEKSGLHSFMLRNYMADLGRWTTADPYSQYSSPYLGMGNNPASGVDPDGGFAWQIPAGVLIGGATAGYIAKVNGASWGEAFLIGIGGAALGGYAGYYFGPKSAGGLGHSLFPAGMFSNFHWPSIPQFNIGGLPKASFELGSIFSTGNTLAGRPFNYQEYFNYNETGQLPGDFFLENGPLASGAIEPVVVEDIAFGGVSSVGRFALRKFLTRGAGKIAARASTKAFTYTKSAGKHLTEVVKRGSNAGQLSRPYMNSPLTIKEIMSTGKGIPDATFKGGMNWRVPGTFRGSQGTWELGINPKTNVIYHFNFVH